MYRLDPAKTSWSTIGKTFAILTMVTMLDRMGSEIRYKGSVVPRIRRPTPPVPTTTIAPEGKMYGG